MEQTPKNWLPSYTVLAPWSKPVTTACWQRFGQTGRRSFEILVESCTEDSWGLDLDNAEDFMNNRE